MVQGATTSTCKLVLVSLALRLTFDPHLLSFCSNKIAIATHTRQKHRVEKHWRCAGTPARPNSPVQDATGSAYSSFLEFIYWVIMLTEYIIIYWDNSEKIFLNHFIFYFSCLVFIYGFIILSHIVIIYWDTMMICHLRLLGAKLICTYLQFIFSLVDCKLSV